MKHLVNKMNKKQTFIIEQGVASEQHRDFFVADGCNGLSFYYDLNVKYTFLVFLMIKQPDGKIRFLKQLGYSEPVISIGATWTNTTIGGIPGEIQQGMWTMKVFLFAEYIEHLIADKTIEFQVGIVYDTSEIIEKTGDDLWVDDTFTYSRYDFSKEYKNDKRWYKGDFHTHTRLSDGKELPVDVNKKSKMMNLDYYVPTEHNTIHSGWPKTDVCIVPGIEITTTLGHANLFGIDQMPAEIERILRDEKKENIIEDFELIIAQCKERGWLFSINHPYLSIWKWLYDEISLAALDSVEICNDPTYGADLQTGALEANAKAVLLADMLWEDGYRICAIGGSDSHNKIDEFYPYAVEPSIPGDPATWLYMDGLTPKHILQAVKSCNCYVARHCTIKSSIKFGSLLEDTCQKLDYTMTLETEEEQPQIFYIHNGKRYKCDRVKKRGTHYMTVGTIRMDAGYQWIRFGVETKEGEFLFYGNAVTRGTKTHSYLNYEEIRKSLEKRWQSKEFYSIKMEH